MPADSRKAFMESVVLGNYRGWAGGSTWTLSPSMSPRTVLYGPVTTSSPGWRPESTSK